MTYSGDKSAWTLAVMRNGVPVVHFHDIKAEALTDVDERRGIRVAQTMDGTSTENQAADYILDKKRRKLGLSAMSKTQKR